MEPLLPADPTLRAVVLATDVISILVAWFLIRRAKTAGRMIDASLAGPAFAGIVGIVSAIAVGLGSFAFLRVVEHAIFLVGVPASLISLVYAWRRRYWVVVSIAAVSGPLLTFVFVWSHYVEPHDLEVTVHEVVTDRLPAGSDGVRVVVLADLQTDDFGDYEQSVFDRIAELEPDLLLLPGDFIQVSGQPFFREHAKFLAALRNLPRPPMGILAVEGDVDPMRWRYREPSAFFDDGAGPIARLLDDEFLPFESPNVLVLGLKQRSSRQPLKQEWIDRIRDFDGLVLIMGHAPDYAIPTIRGETDLDAILIAGHTHGGQVVIPGFGPPITLSAVPREVAGGGLHQFGEALVSVSRGVGLERGYAPRLRLFCRPELVVFDFKPKG
ncbi:MAG: metallophosphoesterase [Planctomycetota bacterium]